MLTRGMLLNGTEERIGLFFVFTKLGRLRLFAASQTENILFNFVIALASNRILDPDTGKTVFYSFMSLNVSRSKT